jgi:hypothetical protein
MKAVLKHIRLNMLGPVIGTLSLVLIASLGLARVSDAASSISSSSNPSTSPCAPAQPCGMSQPASLPVLLYSNGAPDGRMAVASQPANSGIGQIEIEAADDFVVTGAVRVSNASFTGLLPTAALLSSIQQVDVEIYRVFPLDSANPPSGHVPTRVNSPSDVDFDARSTASADLSYTATVVAANFNAANSLVNGINPIPNQTTGGEGPASGEEVQFNVTLNPPFQLATGHYFFIPKVGLSSGNFLWLSAAGPSQAGDLQAWIRNANLDPDWLRIGTDIVGGATSKFNASFSLSGARLVFLPLIHR